MKAIIHASSAAMDSGPAGRLRLGIGLSALAPLIRRVDFEATDMLVRTFGQVSGPAASANPADVPLVLLFGLAAASGRQTLALLRNQTSWRRPDPIDATHDRPSGD